MASDSVQGKTPAQLNDLRREFAESPKDEWYDFEEWYCLAKIPRQPADYDGPNRYCVNTELKKGDRCKFHGGAGGTSYGHLDPLANMKHGMKATRENLFTDMQREGNEWQMELYDWVVEEWPDAYDLDLDSDPLAEYEFHALATEIVRNERTAGYIVREGEKGRKKIFGPDGSVHYEDIPHYLGDMLARNRKLVMRMEDNLGISRKKRLQAEQTSDATDVLKSFAAVGASLVSGADSEYNPGEWGPDDA